VGILLGESPLEEGLLALKIAGAKPHNFMSGYFVKLTAFINEFDWELVEVAKFRDEKAWNLIGQCMATIFETMHPF
jgi:hypothetical protein